MSSHPSKLELRTLKLKKIKTQFPQTSLDPTHTLLAAGKINNKTLDFNKGYKQSSSISNASNIPLLNEKWVSTGIYLHFKLMDKNVL